MSLRYKYCAVLVEVISVTLAVVRNLFFSFISLDLYRIKNVSCRRIDGNEMYHEYDLCYKKLWSFL